MVGRGARAIWDSTRAADARASRQQEQHVLADVLLGLGTPGRESDSAMHVHVASVHAGRLHLSPKRRGLPRRAVQCTVRRTPYLRPHRQLLHVHARPGVEQRTALGHRDDLQGGGWSRGAAVCGK